ncbi:MAG: hypothetical protein A2705_05075 [Omnitrophica WOR_2 bacterium RIFCSPHIGHO2_01_FULL_52_10]|nr:MAG: hypothetical protein A2705_05075 [Omnitrophica WOR_2 bacterium RIFCSPHIGHO2_01_FULL_52_10]
MKTTFAIKFKNTMLEFLALFGRKPQKFLAIDFSQALTGIIYVESSGDGLKLLAYDIQKVLPAGARNEETAVNFIKAFLEKNSIEEKDVLLSISDVDSVVIKFLTMPFIPEKEIRGAAKWKLRDVIPFDLEQSVIDWQFVGDYVDEEGTKNRGMIFIVAMKEIIDHYLLIVNKCNLDPLGITGSSFNYANLLPYVPNNPKVSAVLDVDYKGSTLSIYSNNKLNFVRRLPISWEKLTQSLTEVIVSGEGKIELSRDEAENIENTFGIPEDEKQVVQDKVQATQVISLLRPLLEALVRDLKFSFQYFASNFNSEAPASLYLAGGGSHLKNLDKYLGKELDLPVSYLLLPACVDVQILNKEKLAESDQKKIINALGAAFSGPGAINLLPPKVRAKKEEQIQRMVLRLSAMTGAAIFFLLLLSAQFQVHDYKNRVKNAQVHLKAIAEINELRSKIQLKEDLVEKIREKRTPVAGVLKVISVFVPPELVLEELSLDQGRHDLTLKGTISAVENVAEEILINFMQRLESSPFFDEVGLVSSQRAEPVQKFEISVELGY